MMPPFAALRAFEAVGRLKGFRRAAAALDVNHAVVSRHVTALEQQLGVRLVDRRSGLLSAIGSEYHARITTAIAELKAASDAVRSDRSRELVIWCSPGFAIQWLIPRLPRFTERAGNPSINLRSADTEPALDRGEADGDIRYLPDSQSRESQAAINTITLARPDVYPVASPALLALRGKPFVEASDLAACPLIEEVSSAEWTAWFAAQGCSVTDKPPIARYGQAHLSIAAARAGQGIALANDFLVADHLADGSLVRITATRPLPFTATLGSYVLKVKEVASDDPRHKRLRQWLIKELEHGS